MAGNKIDNTGTVQYANSPISAGKTHSLLSIFTDVSSASPGSGNRMNPRDLTGILSYGYFINAGTYAGSYAINRNDPVGEQIWRNIAANGQWKLGDFPNYIHYPTDNRFVTVWDNSANPQDSMTFQVKCGSNTVLSDTVNPGAIYDPSGGLPYYMASGGGSSGAFVASAINTNWTVQVDLYNVDQNQPTNVMYRIYDYNTNLDYISGIMMLDPSTGWVDSVSYTQRYPSILVVSLQSM